MIGHKRHNASDAKLAKHVKQGGESIALRWCNSNKDISAHTRDTFHSINAHEHSANTTALASKHCMGNTAHAIKDRHRIPRIQPTNTNSMLCFIAVKRKNHACGRELRCMEPR
jgi:hypothetical protein